MKLRELIDRLQQIEATEGGDIEVVMHSELSKNWNFKDPVVEVVMNVRITGDEYQTVEIR